MSYDRRAFLKSGLALLGASFVAPSFVGRALAAGPSRNGKKVLVYLFQRGGADGLSIVPPVGDPAYYAARPTIAIPRPGQDGGAVKLDGTFGLHPSLAPLEPLYRDGVLGLVHAAGLTEPTRSHFDAQDFCESGMPGGKATPDGWLNRALDAEHERSPQPFRAVALQDTLPRSLMGDAAAISLRTLQDFQLRPIAGASAADGFESLYASAVDSALRQTGHETFEAMRALAHDDVFHAPPQNGAQYPNSVLGKRLQDIARLIHAEVGLEIAATDCGGWDTHVAQGSSQGQLAKRLEDFGHALAAFAQDLGPRLADTCLVSMTEFGRTVHENGTHGTDHGTGSVMFVLGGGVRGGRVLGKWRGLQDANLFEGRDLPVEHDYRAVLAEALTAQRGKLALPEVFPGYAPRRLGLFG